MGISTNGFEGLEYDLAKLAEGLSPSAIRRALEAGGRPVVERIAERAPRGPTGRLKEAIKAGKVQRKGDSYFIKLGVVDGASAPHAHLVELGHGGPHPAPAHPFMRPAFDESKDDGYSTIRDTLRGEMTKG